MMTEVCTPHVLSMFCPCRSVRVSARIGIPYVCTAPRLLLLLVRFCKYTHLDLYADESEAGVTPPRFFCFYVSIDFPTFLPTLKTPRPPTHRDIKSVPPTARQE